MFKYKIFKGDGSQDADEWLDDFKCSSIIHQIVDDSRRRVFEGLMIGKARAWYNGLTDQVLGDWDQLTESFLKAFRDPEREAIALRKLSRLRMKSSESFGHYGCRVETLLFKLSTNASDANQVRWYVYGLPRKMCLEILVLLGHMPRDLEDAMDAAFCYLSCFPDALKAECLKQDAEEMKRKKKRRNERKRRSRSSSSGSSSDSLEFIG